MNQDYNLENRPADQAESDNVESVNNSITDPEQAAVTEAPAEVASEEAPTEAPTENDATKQEDEEGCFLGCIGLCFDLILKSWQWIVAAIVLGMICWFGYVIYEETCHASPGENDVRVNGISYGEARHWPYKGYRVYRNSDHRVLVWGSDFVHALDDDMTLVYDIRDTLHLLNCENGSFIPGAFKDTYYSGDNMIAVRTMDDKLSILNSNGKVIFDKLDSWNRQEIPLFKNGYAEYYTSDNGEGLLSTDGRWAIKPGEYSSIHLDLNVCKVVKDGLTGLYDLDSARLIIPCLYRDIYHSTMGNTVAEIFAERSFATDSTYFGDIVIESVQSLGYGMYSYLCKGGYGLLSEAHGLVTPPVYSDITRIGNRILCRTGDRLDIIEDDDDRVFPHPVD